MKMSGEEIIGAARETVWRALNDPEILKECIPGCESIVKHSDTRFEARVIAKVGPVKAGFTGVVNLSELDRPKSYRISGEGKGGLAGFASGGANVKLEDADGGGTRLSYDVDAQVGGKLAMLGSRLIDSTARSMATQFFDKFAKTVSSMRVEAAPDAEAALVKKAAKKPAKGAAKPAKKAGKKKS
jgi:carbon monoxide dehydrogenase subunit G